MIKSYTSLIRKVYLQGTKVKDTREVIGLSLYIPSFTDLNVRALNIIAARDEAMWILSGSSHTSEANGAAKFWADFPLDLGDIYGAHLRDQIKNPIQVDSRRDFYETGVKGAMLPCVNSLQILARQNSIHGVVTQRSADLICGLPHDIITWQYIANKLARRPVSLIWNIGSAHIYENHFSTAKKITNVSPYVRDTTRWDFANPTAKICSAFREPVEIVFQGLDYHK